MDHYSIDGTNEKAIQKNNADSKIHSIKRTIFLTADYNLLSGRVSVNIC